MKSLDHFDAVLKALILDHFTTFISNVIRFKEIKLNKLDISLNTSHNKQLFWFMKGLFKFHTLETFLLQLIITVKVHCTKRCFNDEVNYERRQTSGYNVFC